ncbi:hypothetical protein RMN57_03950 [Kitasatospora sp. CM 4170]|uniref:Uncharacterized protein n=1 Tax=Kitasatospora aburaviensis TaxID=67265 RepID=A0ABW1F8P5_9ACTN|nr:hypothetical protein [Kitasatospora sp. CM 4170]WNM43917.1 hypothetical protein RMN57_03950 [Kitasatospora sp. CM 4170]
MADTGAVSVEEFVREAVRRYRPEELARLDDALTIYFANPATVLAARRREGETGAGAGVGAAAAVVVPALLVILHDLAIALTADAAKGGLRAVWRRVRARFGKPELAVRRDGPVTLLTTDQVAALRPEIERKLAQRLPADLSQALAEYLCGELLAADPLATGDGPETGTRAEAGTRPEAGMHPERRNRSATAEPDGEGARPGLDG